MEKKCEITKETNINIQETSKELKAMGLGEFADYYYEDEEYGSPFFKVEKPFKKEEETDPEFETIYLDVNDEFTVHARIGHDHFNNAKQAVEMVKGLLDGSIAEVALCFNNLTVRFLIRNTLDPQKNVDVINDNAEYIINAVKNLSPMLNSGGHYHQIFNESFAGNFQLLPAENYMYDNCKLYMQSIVMGEYPEIFIC